MNSPTALAMNAAAALDKTHDIGERGPKTFQARKRLALWLDTGRGPEAKVRADIKWLFHVAQEAICAAAEGGDA